MINCLKSPIWETDNLGFAFRQTNPRAHTLNQETTLPPGQRYPKAQNPNSSILWFYSLALLCSEKQRIRGSLSFSIPFYKMGVYHLLEPAADSAISTWDLQACPHEILSSCLEQTASSTLELLPSRLASGPVISPVCSKSLWGKKSSINIHVLYTCMNQFKLPTSRVFAEST